MEDERKYRNVCILLSGGIGSRIGGDVPKQYLHVAGETILSHTFKTVPFWEQADGLLVAADPAWQAEIRESAALRTLPERIAFLGFSGPGRNRQESILNALIAIEPFMEDDSNVMIHDAVRPCVPRELIGRCADALENTDCGGVMPYLPIKDTVYISQGGKYAESTIDRDSLYAGQTPEFFHFWEYLRANEALPETELLKICGSSEPAVRSGMKIALVPGEEANFKITTKEDLARFRGIKEAETEDIAEAAGTCG